MEKTKYNKLLQNSIIFGVGNFGSKLINILLVPLYTYKLTTQEYGTVDLITTTAYLLLPIISISIFEAVLRFALEKGENKSEVFSNGVAVTICGSIISSIIFASLLFLNVVSTMQLYLLTLIIAQSIQTLFAQFARGINENKKFALNGIIMTVVTAVLNILLLVVTNLKVDGYMFSLIFANMIGALFLFFSCKMMKYFDRKTIHVSYIKNMAIYSLPLIPNSIMWWLVNSSSRYFILYFVGPIGNGLFAVANKIPSLLSLLSSIFFQAWQLSAIEEYDSKDKSFFYSRVFNYYSQLLFIATSILVGLIKFVMPYLVEDSFISSWQFVPFLLLSVVYSSFSSFLGTNYIAAKKTKGAFSSSLVGASISILLNILLVPVFGVNGASISAALSFFIVWIYRIWDTRKISKISIDVGNMIANHVVLFMQILALFFIPNLYLIYIEICLVILLIVINHLFFRESLKIFYILVRLTKKNR